VSDEKTRLYAVGWESGRPYIVTVQAVRSKASWRLVPDPDASYADRDAFCYRNVVTEAERADLCIGTDPVEAVYLALESRKRLESNTEKTLLDVRRDLTELAVLGLAEAKVTLCEEGKP
jgi:hypothetical protein